VCRRIALVFCLFVILGIGPAVAELKGADGISIIPDNIRIGFLYGGQKLSVQAEVPSGQDVVVKITGQSEHLELNKKGKVGGLLWMNVADIDCQALPKLYLIASSRKLSEIAAGNVLERLVLGYPALERSSVDDQKSEIRNLFGELIKLKEREKLFSVNENGVRYLQETTDKQRAIADLFLPPKAAAGEYKVEIWAFKGGQGTLLGSGTIKLEPSKLTMLMTSFAENHGLLYGVFAAVAAVLAGLLAGYVFSAGKGKVH
jgi:uncharacterized protein (TIGR02186 family)